MEEYAPFHGHSIFSIRDGVDNVENIVKKHKELGFKSVTLTDHASIANQRILFDECQKQGVQARIGIEWYMILDKYKHAKSNKEVRTYDSGLSHGDDKVFHITSLVLNEQGYQNLLKLKYLSALKESDEIKIDDNYGTFYKRERITEKLIFQYSSGILFTSGCRLSIFNEYLQQNRPDITTQLLLLFIQKCENFLIELHPAYNIVEENMFHWMKEFAFKHNVPCLIANDSHYISRSDLYKWNALGGLRRNKTISASAEDTISNPDFHLKTFDEMWNRVLQLNNNDSKSSIKCMSGHEFLQEKTSFDWNNRRVKKILIPDAEDKLYNALVKGLEKKFGNIEKVPEEYKERLRNEFEVAKITGNCSYYLEVAGIIDYCHNKNFMTPVNRGSAGSLLILYLLGITQIDPLVYGLIAERASNSQRITEMDIDLDFNGEIVEDIVKNYLKPRFGTSNIVNVVNYGYVHLPLAIRSSMKYLEYSEHIKNKISKAIKQKFVEIKFQGDEEIEVAPEITAIEGLEDFQQIFKENGIDNYKDIFKYAKAFQGTINNASIHASALVILSDEIYKQLPVKRVGDVMCCEFSQECLKPLGVLKLDLLSVSTYKKMDETILRYNEALI